MRLNVSLRWTGLLRSKHTAHDVRMACMLAVLCLVSGQGSRLWAQSFSTPAGTDQAQGSGRAGSAGLAAHRMRAQRFLDGRIATAGQTVSAAMDAARQQQAAMVTAQAGGSQAGGSGTALNASWQAIGPNQIASAAYGNVTGRVTAVAIDPADASGNTVYLGTTGGGVWKSTNAAGAASAVSFTPLTDTLSVFSGNAGTTAVPSLNIGALSVQNGVILAGTGDPNDALDSYYGGGLLRSVDSGLTWTLIQGSQDGVAGRHSFVGLGVSGFAWSGAAANVFVVAISDSLEGDLVHAADPTNSVRGLYFSTDSGVTWQMSVVMDGGQTVQRPQPTGGNVGGNAATAVVWNPVRQRFYAAVRYHGYYESADGVTWTRLTAQPATTLPLSACPTNPGTTGNPSCRDLSRGAGSAAGDG